LNPVYESLNIVLAQRKRSLDDYRARYPFAVSTRCAVGLRGAGDSGARIPTAWVTSSVVINRSCRFLAIVTRYKQPSRMSPNVDVLQGI
jgi:hypothetical protein